MKSLTDLAALDGGTTKMLGVEPTCAIGTICPKKSYGSLRYSDGATASEIGQNSSV
jgi:hypothetical protein